MYIEIKSQSLKIARLQSESHTINLRGARKTQLKAESFVGHILIRSETEVIGIALYHLLRSKE